MPEQPTTMITVEPFAEEIMERARRMRASIDVPADIDSPFFIARFLAGHNGNEEIARRRISEYLTHRRCLGYGNYDQLGVFTKCPIGKETYERFGISLIQDVSSNNVHVFVQKMKNTRLNDIMKVIPLSYVLHSYFMLQDLFARVVAKTEKETGRPASVVCVLDLEGLNMNDFINPFFPAIKLAKHVVNIWADYFSTNMCKILLINPPAAVSVMWLVTKWIMDARTISKLAMLNGPEDLHQFLEKEVIPVSYGGSWSDNSGYSDPPESCCRQPRPVVSSDHKVIEDIWREHNVDKPRPQSHKIGSLGTVEIKEHIPAPATLIWSYTVSGDVQFEIVHVEAGKEKHIWPKITLTSLKLGEFGNVALPAGDITIRFTNPNSTWQSVKLTLSHVVKY